MSQNLDWTYVAEEHEVPKNEGRRVSKGSVQVGLFNSAEGFYAVDNRCPHRQGPLSEGILSGNTVTCPLHNWHIQLDNGCVTTGGEGRVNCYPVKVENGKVYIAFNNPV